MSKVTRFPGGRRRRRRLNLTKNRVMCQVSGRWLQFPEKAHAFTIGTYISVDVMTRDIDDEERKLCELAPTTSRSRPRAVNDSTARDTTAPIT